MHSVKKCHKIQMSAYENQTKLKELSEIWQHVLLEWLLERLGRSLSSFTYKDSHGVYVTLILLWLF